MHFAKIASMAKKGLKALNTAKQIGQNENSQGPSIPAMAGIGCLAISGLMSFITTIIILGSVLAPIIGAIVVVENVVKSLKDFGESAWNFITTGCAGLDEYCENKAQEKFYKELDVVYEKYEEKYSVKINTGLIAATLLYNTEDFNEKFKEIETELEEDGEIDDIVDASNIKWSKLTKKISDLAKEQVSKRIDRYCKTCTRKEGEPYVNILQESISLGLKEKPGAWSCNDTSLCKDEGRIVYYVDLERYEKFLKEEYIEKNFLKEKDVDDKKSAIEDISDEIFSIADTAYSLVYGDDIFYTGSGYYDTSCNFNLTQVDVLSYAGDVLTTLSMEDYIIGVTYAEVGFIPSNIEYMKTQMVAAKTYALVRGKYDSNTKKISIKASTSDQAWCDVYDGCKLYYAGYAGSTQLQWFYPETYQHIPGEAVPYKGPLSSSQITQMKTIYKEIEGYLYAPTSLQGPVNSYSDLTSTGYVSTIQNSWEAWGKEGKGFKEILDLTSTIRDDYKDHYLYSISDYCKYNTMAGTCTTSVPIKIPQGGKYNISSDYGYRIHPIEKVEKLHTGIDLSYEAGTPIYNIYDGTVLSVSNEASSCGLGVSIGHDINGDGKTDYKSQYCHMVSGSLLVSAGQFVTGGMQIGQVGSTGASTGNHLHFGIYDFSVNDYVDSMPFLEQLIKKVSVFDSAVCSVNDVTKLSELYQSNYSNIQLCTSSDGSKNTVATSGCLISAYAGAYYSLIGQVPVMQTLANDFLNISGYLCDQGGSAPTLFSNEDMKNKYQIVGNSMGTSVSYDEVVSKLKSNYRIIVSVKNGSNNTAEGGFNSSDGSHFIMLDHVSSDGKIYVFNPSRGTNEGYRTKDEIEKFVLNKIYSGMWYVGKAM